jgi:hypothetical protein
MFIRQPIPGRSTGLISGLAAIILTFGAGCHKPESSLPPAPPNSSALSPDTTVRVHWLGKRKMQLRINYYYLVRVWQLPISAGLQTRSLSRLAAAPARWLAVPPERAQLVTPLLEQSLKDIMLEECYLEIRQPTNQPADLAFAIHLDAERVGNWETNVANSIGLLTGAWPVPAKNGIHGWSLQRTQSPNSLQFLRVNDWAVFGVGTDANALFSEVCDRVRRYDDPFGAHASTNWLEAYANLARLREPLARAWPLSGNLPQISLALTGDGANLLTYGQLTFPDPLHLEIEPWTPPADLIQEPLDSFTAVRGFRPWLSSLKVWHDLPLAAPPGQLYFWSIPGKTSQAYFAAPLSDASNQVNRLTGYLMDQSNPWLAARGYVQFQRLPDANGVSWGNLPAIQPFFKFVNTAGGGAVFGGLLPDTTPGTNTQDNIYQRLSPARLFDQLSAQTNLVYYDWELTGLRIQPCLYLGQVARVVSRHPQLPLESPGLQWLQTIQPRLGVCTTMVTCTGTNQLSFFRKSTVGFTSAELQLLADWLESPQFPCGLYSLSPTPAQP